MDKVVIGFVGGGQMVSAMIEALVEKKAVPPQRIIVSDR
jgi:pyrroline-5-carboxylate reductase